MMDKAVAAELRAPFPAELVNKLPRLWCGACRDARGKVCDQHRKAKCGECGNNITSAHLHLDYVGHADITDRLLQVDPWWTWEPVAFAPDGLPLLDRFGGLWIRLTVANVTRLGYGHADGKQGPDAVKEAIGDALRNAAMRFGVALDLWRKETPDHAPRAPQGPPQPAPQYDANDPRVLRRRVETLFARAGLKGEDRLKFCQVVVGRPIASSEELRAADWPDIIAGLEAAIAQKQGQEEPA